MLTIRLNHLQILFLNLALVMGLVSCANDPYYAGPPPHAHHHSYEYYYYPSVQVYFNYTTGYYYYASGAYWKHTRVLPPAIRLDRRDRMVVQIDNAKPYSKHSEHRNKYRPQPDYHPDTYRDRAERKHHKEIHKKHKNKQK